MGFGAKLRLPRAFGALYCSGNTYKYTVGLYYQYTTEAWSILSVICEGAILPFPPANRTLPVVHLLRLDSCKNPKSSGQKSTWNGTKCQKTNLAARLGLDHLRILVFRQIPHWILWQGKNRDGYEAEKRRGKFVNISGSATASVSHHVLFLDQTSKKPCHFGSASQSR